MNSRIKYIVYFFLPFIFNYNVGLCQSINATVNRNRIFIGEQIQMKLSMQRVRAGTSWFNIPDSLNHIEVVSRGKIDTVSAAGYYNYSQTLNLTSFDSGRWQIPGLTVPGINRITVPITIDVLPVDVSQLKDYHDIRDIEEVAALTDWKIIAIIAIVTLLSLAIIIWLILKRKEIQSVQPVRLPDNLSPLDWALGELDKLMRRDVQSQQEAKKYYSELNELSRRFFELQLQQNSLRQTTDEWMIDLQPLEVEPDTKTAFFQFLRLADTVKFAKYQPSARENETAIDVIKQMVQRVALLHSNLYSKYQPQ